MTGTDDLQDRLARLDRLRRLGLHRGISNLISARHAHDGPAQGVSDARGANSTRAASGPGGTASAAASNSGPERRDLPALPGEEVQTPLGPAWERVARYPLAEFPSLTEWLQTSPAALAALDRNEALLDLDPAQVAFVDTETTGLSPDTGTYTFLIGVGTFELPTAGSPKDGAFVVRQFFMRHPGEEQAQLHLVERALDRCTGLVSFNGRGFDLPLLANRFILAGMPLPLLAAPHLDLLPPARRLWRIHLGSCRLISLEHSVLGFTRPLDDVPGYLIPGIYQQFYRTGVVTEMLVRVFNHNLYDIFSMPLLAAHMARFFREDRPLGDLDGLPPLTRLSLGRCYEALGWHAASIAAYRAALAGALSPAERTQVLRELSLLYKRLGERELAATLWEEWVSTDSDQDLTPYVELAKHHEWHTGDLRAAHGWAAWAVHIAEKTLTGYHRDSLLADLRHRLARLERKLAEAADKPSTLKG